MQFKSFVLLSYDSFIRTAWPIGIDGNTLPLCSKTAFRLNFEESMNSLHSSGLWLILRAPIRPSTSLQVTRLPSILKNGIKPFWRAQNADTVTFSSRRSHCCSLEANSSELLFDSFRSLTRSFNSFYVILCGSEDITVGSKSGSLDVDGQGES